MRRRSRRAFLLAFALTMAAGTHPRADASKLRTYVRTLASEKFGGRMTGTEGETLAREFIISELKRIGAKPLPGRSNFEAPFEFTAGTRDGGSTVGFTITNPGANGSGSTVPPRADQARALSFSDNGDVDGPVIFAGYGIVVPDSQDFGYDSYAALDVKDKVVLVLRYFPEDADQKTKAILSRYADLRYKAMAARQHGAKAMLVVTGPQSPNAGELAPMTFDTAIAGSGILALSIVGPMADALFATAGKTVAETQKALDSGDPHVAGFPLTGVRAQVHADVIRETRTGRNVIAYLPATSAAAGPKPWLAVGAHYDHLGLGGNGLSLASKEDAGRVHGGADDNASGTAAVLALADTLSTERRRRNIAFNFWSGEELGLLGSAAFASRPPIPLAEIEAYLNFDMVGRMQDNKLNVQASGSSPVWDKLIEQANVKAGFDLRLQPDPYQPTDVQTFNLASIPSLNFFTGSHVDYHKPSDTSDKIDYEDLDRIVDFAAAILRRLDSLTDAPAFTKVEPQTQGGASRTGVRIFTGTIPDYASDAKGLLLGGVVGGGPAEQAGLQKGDVIVEIAGQTITNIYDYTYALEVLKVGQAAKVVYMRDGQRKETTLTPSARK
jgi:hypothetical protein